MKHLFWRYFWWLRFPKYWWQNWRYDGREVPFDPKKTNYVLGYNEEPQMYASAFYKGPVDPRIFLFSIEGEPLDRVWCAQIPPAYPYRPMPKGTVAT